MEHDVLQDLVVATDSALVAQVVERAGVRAILTNDGHVSGTDRVAEAVGRPEFAEFDVVGQRARQPAIFAPRRPGSGDQSGSSWATTSGPRRPPLEVELVDDPSRVQGRDRRARSGALLLPGRHSAPPRVERDRPTGSTGSTSASTCIDAPRFLVTLFFYAVHEVVYFAVARGLVKLTLEWSWGHEIGGALLNAATAAILFTLLDRLKQRA